MTIWLASGNKHKLQEISAVLADSGIKNDIDINLPAEAGITGFDPKETGTTFAENALIKARALHCLLKGAQVNNSGPVLADDSGLCVDILEGKPGIYSARYYGKESWNSDGSFCESTGSGKLRDEERNILLLEELKTRQSAEERLRKCRFVCAMVLFFGPDRFYLVQETLEGEIVSSPAEIRGQGGFGYDPIVYLPELGRTVAELSEDKKNRYSHRGKAGRLIVKLLTGSLFV
ncbi:MAG: non-canonical purine NTP pyrophosphatase [Treponema sp.]|jgi:XTP/dITP diphosphohydrolase|nr:non-canonical purine NTP pyrophosphatase [Treponema sp.]